MFTYIYIYAVPHPHHTTGGGEHSSCLSIPIPTTNYYSLLLTTTNPPHPPTNPQDGAGNIAPVYPYPFLLLTTNYY